MFIPFLFIAYLIGVRLLPIRKSKKILLCGLWLTIFWLLSIHSVSIHSSFKHTLKYGIEHISNYFYFYGQIKSIIVSLIIGYIVYKLPLKIFTKPQTIYIIAGLAFLLQIAVFIPGIGGEYNGARWWIAIKGIPNIQPSELFKIAYVMFMTSWFIRKKNTMKEKKFITGFILINIILLGVFLIIPDLGTVLILGIVSLIMVRYAGLDNKKLWIIIGTALWCFITFLTLINIFWSWTEIIETTDSNWNITTTTTTKTNKFTYLKNRFGIYFSNDEQKEQDKKGIWYQNHQALLAIGGGWFWGQGYGKGLQKFWFIPEAQSDFIFAAYSEEIGLLGNISLLGLYFFMMYFFMIKIKENKDEYSRLLWIGLISILIVQMFINIGVNLAILPNTGITLPFISHGGTAFMANIIQIMLLYKITQQNEQHTLWYKTR